MSDLSVPEMASEMIARGVTRVHVLAWRDFEDAEAGGSEDHAHEFMTRWQQAGLSVLHRTSHAPGSADDIKEKWVRRYSSRGPHDGFPANDVE